MIWMARIQRPESMIAEHAVDCWEIIPDNRGILLEKLFTCLSNQYQHEHYRLKKER